MAESNSTPHPAKAFTDTVALAGEIGTSIRRKTEEIYDNSFLNNLEKIEFLKEIGGSESYRR